MLTRQLPVNTRVLGVFAARAETPTRVLCVGESRALNTPAFIIPAMRAQLITASLSAGPPPERRPLGGAAPSARGLGSAAPARPDCSTSAIELYASALELARRDNFDAARDAFQRAVAACPQWDTPWVSFAQCERRAAGADADECVRRCREVLQAALRMNPRSARIICAWGLMVSSVASAIQSRKHPGK
jgi:hypothetical protein